MVFKEFGSSTLSKLVQFANALLSIVSREFPNSTDCRAVQLSNADGPILARESPNITVSKALQLLKARICISVTDFGISISSTLVQL